MSATGKSLMEQPELVESLTRPIIGIENRTALEAFDIMADRIRRALTTAADDALRDDAELAKRLRAESLHIFPANQRDGHAYHSTAYLLDKAAERLERIASRLRSPSPDGEVTEEMVEAGTLELQSCVVVDEPEEIVRAIFKAMISARSGG